MDAGKIYRDPNAVKNWKSGDNLGDVAKSGLKTVSKVKGFFKAWKEVIFTKMTIKDYWAARKSLKVAVINLSALSKDYIAEFKNEGGTDIEIKEFELLLEGGDKNKIEDFISGISNAREDKRVKLKEGIKGIEEKLSNLGEGEGNEGVKKFISLLHKGDEDKITKFISLLHKGDEDKITKFISLLHKGDGDKITKFKLLLEGGDEDKIKDFISLTVKEGEDKKIPNEELEKSGDELPKDVFDIELAVHQRIVNAGKQRDDKVKEEALEEKIIKFISLLKGGDTAELLKISKSCDSLNEKKLELSDIKTKRILQANPLNRINCLMLETFRPSALS